MESSERLVATTRFGTVSDRRIVLTRGRPRVPIDLAVPQVTMVSDDVVRYPFIGAVLLLGGLLLIIGSRGNPDRIILGLFGGLIGPYFLAGWPRVTIRTSDGQRYALRGRPWEKAEAAVFANAIRGVLGQPGR